MDWSIIIFLINGSNVRIKRRGERGHPCLVPLEMRIGSDREPFTLTCAEGFLYNTEIHVNIWSPKPTNLQVSLIKSHTTRSEAFSATVDRRRLSILHWSTAYIKLSDLITLSFASLPGMNPVCSNLINLGRRDLILLAMIFAMSLTSRFNREIGL